MNKRSSSVTKINTQKIKNPFMGRLNRGSFTVFMFFLGIVANIFSLQVHKPYSFDLYGIFISIILVMLVMLALSFWIKRLHDIGRSGYWSALLLIPYFDIVMFLYLIFKKGQKGTNKYGEAPTGGILF